MYGPGYGYPHAYRDPSAPDSTKLMITLVLWFFMGIFGAHRFYLGHINTGIVMFVLTIVGIGTTCLVIGFIPLAVTGVWALIDLILMLTGNLKPTDGSRIV